jgi:hypothetical protein
MKPRTHRYSQRSFGRRLGATTLIASLASLASATSVSAVEEAETPSVSGTLNLSGNTHFVSYGQDIWGVGNDWGENSPVFNPSIELSLDLGKGWSGILGTWWDVNNNADSSIGNAIQEVDVWAGLGYGVDKWSFTLLYQDWMYAEQSERIVDFIVAYDHWLNPSLTLHARVDHGIPAAEIDGREHDFDNGLAVVLGIAPGKELGPVALSFPLKVAFDTDGYHAGDAGFSFASAGVNASIPLSFITKGDWTFSTGLIFYYTNDDVIPTNPDDAFITANAGVSLSF